MGAQGPEECRVADSPRSLLQRRSHGVNSFFRIFPAPHAGRKT